MQHPLPAEQLPQQVAQATDPGHPAERKLAVARGVLPMSPDHLLLCLYQLSHDPDEGVQRIARETLQGLPSEMLLATIRRLEHPEVLDLMATIHSAKSDRMEAVLMNRATADETVERVARSCSKAVTELVAANQERLLRHPAIIENLYFNKNTRMSTIDRVVSFAIRQGLVLEGIPAFRELAASIGVQDRKGQHATSSEPEASRKLDVMFDSLASMGEEDAETDRESLELLGQSPLRASLVDDDVFDEFEEGSKDAKKDDLFSEFDRKAGKKKDEDDEDGELQLHYQVSKLSVPQKIRLALLGNASHRSLLVTDSNKIVAMAAIKSPSITDQEVLKYATSRNVSEDVIRYIGTRREWTRNYFVKVNLVNNPKTPIATAMQFLNHLRPHDLKGLINNKNVPSALTQAAKNRLKARQTR